MPYHHTTPRNVHFLDTYFFRSPATSLLRRQELEKDTGFRRELLFQLI